VRFSVAAVNEMKRRFMGTFWNTYAFFVLYAHIDGFERQAYSEFPADDHKTVIDRWIESRLHSLIHEVDTKLEAYDITTAARALESFTDDLSNWYVRRSRERFWGAGLDEDKITAYIVLHDVLVTMAHLIAPFTPFMAETVYQNLVVGHLEGAPESVHLCNFPSVDETKIDRALERDMGRVLEIVSLGRAARNVAQLKIRQPLAEMIVVGSEPLSDELTELVLDELNIKEMVNEENNRRLVDYSFKPQLRTLGRLMGANLPKGRQLIEALPGRATMDRLERDGKIELEVEGTVYDLTRKDFLIEEVPAAGFAVESAGSVTVALNTVLTEQLIEEGLIREMVSKIQTMRRSSDRLSLPHSMVLSQHIGVESNAARAKH
jgi:isoleucyl-tRNA synthetase